MKQTPARQIYITNEAGARLLFDTSEQQFIRKMGDFVIHSKNNKWKAQTEAFLSTVLKVATVAKKNLHRFEFRYDGESESIDVNARQSLVPLLPLLCSALLSSALLCAAALLCSATRLDSTRLDSVSARAAKPHMPPRSRSLSTMQTKMDVCPHCITSVLLRFPAFTHRGSIWSARQERGPGTHSERPEVQTERVVAEGVGDKSSKNGATVERFTLSLSLSRSASASALRRDALLQIAMAPPSPFRDALGGML